MAAIQNPPINSAQQSNSNVVNNNKQEEHMRNNETTTSQDPNFKGVICIDQSGTLEIATQNYFLRTNGTAYVKDYEGKIIEMAPYNEATDILVSTKDTGARDGEAIGKDVRLIKHGKTISSQLKGLAEKGYKIVMTSTNGYSRCEETIAHLTQHAKANIFDGLLVAKTCTQTRRIKDENGNDKIKEKKLVFNSQNQPVMDQSTGQQKVTTVYENKDYQAPVLQFSENKLPDNRKQVKEYLEKTEDTTTTAEVPLFLNNEEIEGSKVTLIPYDNALDNHKSETYKRTKEYYGLTNNDGKVKIGLDDNKDIVQTIRSNGFESHYIDNTAIYMHPDTNVKVKEHSTDIGRAIGGIHQKLLGNAVQQTTTTSSITSNRPKEPEMVSLIIGTFWANFIVKVDKNLPKLAFIAEIKKQIAAKTLFKECDLTSNFKYIEEDESFTVERIAELNDIFVSAPNPAKLSKRGDKTFTTTADNTTNSNNHEEPAENPKPQMGQAQPKTHANNAWQNKSIAIGAGAATIGLGLVATFVIGMALNAATFGIGGTLFWALAIGGAALAATGGAAIVAGKVKQNTINPIDCKTLIEEYNTTHIGNGIDLKAAPTSSVLDPQSQDAGVTTKQLSWGDYAKAQWSGIANTTERVR